MTTHQGTDFRKRQGLDVHAEAPIGNRQHTQVSEFLVCGRTNLCVLSVPNGSFRMDSQAFPES